MKTCRFVLLALLAIALALLRAAASEALVTSVHSKTLNGYKREKRPDGSFKPEYYALSNGGAVTGTTRDESIERLAFPRLADVLGTHLAAKNYFMAKDAKSASLLIVVYWGRTVPYFDTNSDSALDQLSSAVTAFNRDAQVRAGPTPEGEAPDDAGARDSRKFQAYDDMWASLATLDFFNKGRQRAIRDNAVLLGYIDEMNEANDIRRLSAGNDHYLDLRDDMEESRYYLVVLAYDFRELVGRKHRKLLWGTRISIRAQRHAFDRDFAAMLAKAARHLGQDSGGLLRNYDPKGRVDIGEMEVIGIGPSPTPAAEKR
jgi:hypothetical protein